MVKKIGICFAITGMLFFSASGSGLTSAWAANGGDDNAGWFIPKSSQLKPNSPAPARSKTRRVAPPSSSIPASSDATMDESGDAQSQAQPILPLPPIPTPTPVAKGNPPPAVVAGVISVPEVMHRSTAAQEAEKILMARRDKLQQDVQEEQKAWRAEQQQIQARAKSMTAEQIQASERKLQTRVLKAQRDFRDRNRIIQEAAQVAFGQIERELVQIIQQVAASRSMNLVLHREQVALNINELDITEAVLKHLNTNLPSVFVPPADVDPEELAKSGTMPTTANPTPVNANNSSGKSVVIQKTTQPSELQK